MYGVGLAEVGLVVGTLDTGLLVVGREEYCQGVGSAVAGPIVVSSFNVGKPVVGVFVVGKTLAFTMSVVVVQKS